MMYVILTIYAVALGALFALLKVMRERKKSGK